MRDQLKLLIILLCLIIGALRCSQIYDPRLETQGDILAVEAHMTDEQETYFVKLSLTTRFNSASKSNPVSDASVWVTDNNSKSIYLYSETVKGNYSFTPAADEIGIIGHFYTLHIRTADGAEYESASEMMTPQVQVDKVYGIKKIKTELFQSPEGGEATSVKKAYIDIITDIHSDKDSILRVRFDPGWIFEMIDYHRDIIGGPPVPPTYSWTYTKNNSLTINEASDNNILKEQYAGSLPIDNLSAQYGKRNLVSIILVLNYFSLNKNSFRFYNDMNKQLSSEDALFDPIAQQIEGNIRCVNNTETQVTGLFEVASHNIAVFLVNPNNENSPPTLKKVQNFPGLPTESSGKTEGIPPSWWLE
jgi:hypothetical protein